MYVQNYYRQTPNIHTQKITTTVKLLKGISQNAREKKEVLLTLC
jgi:hypothetical protein